MRIVFVYSSKCVRTTLSKVLKCSGLRIIVQNENLFSETFCKKLAFFFLWVAANLIWQRRIQNLVKRLKTERLAKIANGFYPLTIFKNASS